MQLPRHSPLTNDPLDLTRAYGSVRVATCARRRGGSVKENLPVFNCAELHVASLTGRVKVCAPQREDRLLMIKASRAPSARVMALHTARHMIGVCELRPVWVVMTLLAGQRRRAEFHIRQLALHRGRPVAPDAFDSLMCAR